MYQSADAGHFCLTDNSLLSSHTGFNKHAIKMEPQIILTRQQDIKNTFIISN